MILAAKRGSEVIVRYLCDHPKTEVNFCIAKDGITALMAAAQRGYEKVIAVQRKMTGSDVSGYYSFFVKPEAHAIAEENVRWPF